MYFFRYCRKGSFTEKIFDLLINDEGKIEKIYGADHRMKKDGELEKAINIAVKYSTENK